MMIEIRQMEQAELPRIAEIDRSEQIEYKYVMNEGKLEKVDFQLNVPTWGANLIEANIKMLRLKLEIGGVLLGAFDGQRLVGVAVLGGEWLNEDQDELQMAFLYVSNGYRRFGIARQLMDELCQQARAKGAQRLYISGTETNSAVEFYLRYGCKLAEKVNEQLFELEPLDIHLTYAL